MKSRLGRRNAVLYSLPTITSILLRLVPALIFGWFAVDYFYDAPLRGEIVDIVEYRLRGRIATNPQFIIRFLVLGGLAIFSLYSVSNIITTIDNEYKKKKDLIVVSATEFIFRNRKIRKNYVLILRPFGSDGNLYVPKSKKFIARMINPATNNTTMEQIVSETSRLHMGCDTISVADPSSDILAPGPTYVSCSEDWRAEVRLLIQASSAVVILFPPTSSMTPSIREELELCRQLAWQKRVAVVFPTSDQKQKNPLREILSEVSLFSDIADDLQSLQIKQRDLFAVVLGQSTLFWHEKRWISLFGKLQHTNSQIYEQFFEDWFKEMNKNLKNRL